MLRNIKLKKKLLKRKSYFVGPNEIFTNTDLDPYDKLIFLLLLNKKTDYQPSSRNISRDLGIARGKVQTSIKKMVALGLIKVSSTTSYSNVTLIKFPGGPSDEPISENKWPSSEASVASPTDHEVAQGTSHSKELYKNRSNLSKNEKEREEILDTIPDEFNTPENSKIFDELQELDFINQCPVEPKVRPD